MAGNKESSVQWLIVILGVFLIIIGVFYNIAHYQSREIRYLYNDEKVVASPGELIEIELVIENNRNINLSSVDSYFLSYHVLDTKGNVILFDGARTAIDIPVRAKRKVKMQIAAPWEEGEYYLQLDIVHEGVEWLSWTEKKETNILLEVVDKSRK